MQHTSKQHRDAAKVVRVIDSCLTMGQLNSASRMIDAYDKTYGTYSSELHGFYHYKWTCVANSYILPKEPA